MASVKDLSEIRRSASWVPWLTGAVTTLLLWLTRPLVVSGDGVGYIKRLLSPEWDVVPGHLIYVPLQVGLRRWLAPAGGHGDAASMATAFSAVRALLTA